MHWWVNTVAVCTHDDGGEDELQRSQGNVDRSIRRYVYRHFLGHDMQRSVIESRAVIKNVELTKN